MLQRDIIKRKRLDILRIADRYGAHDVRIFGSVARGDAGETSDIDLLVRFDPDRSLFDQGGLIEDLRDLLGMKVDMVSEGALSGRFGENVLQNARLL